MNTRQRIEMLSPQSDCHMADDWYKFISIDHFWIKWRFEALQKIIPKDYIWGKTFEIGCGTGVLREQVEQFSGCTVIGCDLNLKALQMAIESSSPLYFYNIHQRHEDFKERFSTILLLDVLEHINDPVSFLNSVSFHLKKGGKCIINVPAFQFLYSQYDEVAGHIRRYNIPNLKNELHLAGFGIKSAAYWGMSLIPLLMIRKFIVHFYRKDQIIKVGIKSSPLVDFIFRFIMRIEYAIFPKPPAGTSLIVVAQKE